MRTVIDISDDQLAELDGIARAEKTSRDAIVRRAIAALLASRRGEDEAPDPLAASFGLWGKDGEDGLACQDRLRSEWTERS
jgi:hypothetical protein